MGDLEILFTYNKNVVCFKLVQCLRSQLQKQMRFLYFNVLDHCFVVIILSIINLTIVMDIAKKRFGNREIIVFERNENADQNCQTYIASLKCHLTFLSRLL